MKIDYRKNYYMVIDTETFGDTKDNAHVFDIGFVVIDKKGQVYKSGSYGVKEFWSEHTDKISQAFYYDMNRKRYHKNIKNGEMEIKPFFEIRKIIYDVAQTYRIKAFVAHNMDFDFTALNFTTRVLSNNSKRMFLDPNIPRFCTLALSQQIYRQRPSYQQFCAIERKNRTTKQSEPKMTAEIIYQYVSGLDNFKEIHTGKEDAIIESQILAHIFRQKKKINWTASAKKPWEMLPAVV